MCITYCHLNLFVNTVFATYAPNDEWLPCRESPLPLASTILPMIKNIQIVTDPIGYEIYLPAELFRQAESLPQGCDDMKHVLETPACIIELPNRRRCYFRSLAWNVTILVSVVYAGEQWKAVSYLRNPGREYIQQLLQEGTFVACGSLDQGL